MFNFLQLSLDFLAPQTPPAAATGLGGTHPAPAAPPAEPAAARVYRHPRASRELRLGDALVAYEFKRARRRTIGFCVGPDGLEVRAPRWVALGEVHAALSAKADWIVRKLDEARERGARLEASRIDWADGAEFAFLGRKVSLRLDSPLSAGGAALLAQSDPAQPHAPMHLHLGLPRQARPEQIRDAVQAWLMRQARRIFAERLDHFAPRLAVRWTRLSLSNAGTRWGSARADGSIRLHWRLVHFRMEVIDYVVAHELSHLRVMDHSPRFWDTVGAVVPDYARVRRELRDEPIAPWT